MDAPDAARSRATRDLVLDAVTAIGLTVFSWLLVSMTRGFFVMRGLPIPLRGGPGYFHGGPSLLTYALLGAAFLPLAVRRRYPVPVLLIVAAANAAYALVPGPAAVPLIGVLVALYTLGANTSRRSLALWGGVATLMVLATALPAPNSEMFLADVVRAVAVLLAAALLGDATRNRRAYVAEVERRAVEAERTREEEAKRRVDEERLRIARELHDVTAHSLSVIAVQSGAAAHVLDTKPEEARRAIAAIRETSRDALQELRGMLGVLRGTDDESAPLAPAVGLARLDDLVRPLEEAGLSVDVVKTGDLSDVPAIVDTSAYRIVQEALTNVLRHAGGAHVRVEVRLESAALSVEVTDDGRAETAGGEGHGIAGMRERAAALGGTFEAGPAGGAGWRVSARLPVSGRVA